jgi:hypothetical protein
MAALFKSMVAYTGRWSNDDERLLTRVDRAWDPSRVGTGQVRYYTFDGHTLTVRTMPLDRLAFPDQKVSVTSTGNGKHEPYELRLKKMVKPQRDMA